MYSTSRSTKWKRVSRTNRCPICGKADWCLFSGDDGNPDAVICSRVESQKRVGTKGAGWLHRIRDDDGWRDRPRQQRVTIEAKAAPAISFDKMAAEYEAALGPLRRGLLAHQLGVSDYSLSALQVGWSERHQSFTFPMRDGNGYVCGIRLRRADGSKWAVKGSRQGLFVSHVKSRLGLIVPDDWEDLLVVCEGPTDTAAVLDLGFVAVGRPSCNGGESQLLGLILSDGRFVPRQVVIVADDDRPGQRGAWKLATTLVSYVCSVKVISPPTGIKDAREWVRQGATHADIAAAIDETPALQLIYKGVQR